MELKALTKEFTDMAVVIKSAIIGYFPQLCVALLLVVLGLVFAILARYIGEKIGQLIQVFLSRIETRFNLTGRRGIWQHTSTLLGSVCYWLVFIYFLFFALKILSIPGVMGWVMQLTQFIPRLLGAFIIVYAGFLLGAIVRNIICPEKKKEKRSDRYFLAQVSRFSIILVFFVWGVGQLGVNINILSSFINILVATVLGAAGLGFGLGSRAQVANMIAAFHFRKRFEIGDVIRIQEYHGTIANITHDTIVLETKEGLVAIPAHIAQNEVVLKDTR